MFQPTYSTAVSLEEYARKIANADVYDVAARTLLQEAPRLGALTGRRVYLKREDQQTVFSFKIRGAANKIKSLGQEERDAGVITASAGNHAQGVALAAKRVGIKATVVMPRTTPDIKVNAVRSHGAEVVLHGDSFASALRHALELCGERELTFIHPYDDVDVIAGQGTIGKEVLEQHSGPIEAIFVPVGGGGLVAGIVAWVKHIRPEVKVIGVEPEGADCLHQALNAGSRVRLAQVGLFADGVAVAQVGERPFNLLRDYLDETIVVSVEEICAAAWDIFGDTRTIPEPAGAVATAGLKKYAEMHPSKSNEALVSIVSGANVDSDRVRYMAERIAIGQKREMLMAVKLPEQPGALLAFCRHLNGYGITEFNYRCADERGAQIFVGLRVSNSTKEGPSILAKLRENGYELSDLTDNDLAKEHIRHMVGGHPPCVLNEALYSFEFPERPGALLAFLEAMPRVWNISLFHYRSHGASHGRVLIGLQVPQGDGGRLKEHIKIGDYRGLNQTKNAAYGLFLGSPPMSDRNAAY